jgi:hypothetical protein
LRGGRQTAAEPDFNNAYRAFSWRPFASDAALNDDCANYTATAPLAKVEQGTARDCDWPHRRDQAGCFGAGGG